MRFSHTGLNLTELNQAAVYKLQMRFQRQVAQGGRPDERNKNWNEKKYRQIKMFFRSSCQVNGSSWFLISELKSRRLTTLLSPLFSELQRASILNCPFHFAMSLSFPFIVPQPERSLCKACAHPSPFN